MDKILCLFIVIAYFLNAFVFEFSWKLNNFNSEKFYLVLFSLWLFAGNLWLFVEVCGCLLVVCHRLCSLPVLVTAILKLFVTSIIIFVIMIFVTLSAYCEHYPNKVNYATLWLNSVSLEISFAATLTPKLYFGWTFWLSHGPPKKAKKIESGWDVN